MATDDVSAFPPGGTTAAMGIIRKTASIATLGLVNWKSTKERLEEERAARDQAEAQLESTAEELSMSRRQMRRARKKAKKAELAQLKAEKRLARRSMFRRRTLKGAEKLGEARGAKRLGFGLLKRRARKASQTATDAASDVLPG